MVKNWKPFQCRFKIFLITVHTAKWIVTLAISNPHDCSLIWAFFSIGIAAETAESAKVARSISPPLPCSTLASSTGNWCRKEGENVNNIGNPVLEDCPRRADNDNGYRNWYEYGTKRASVIAQLWAGITVFSADGLLHNRIHGLTSTPALFPILSF